MINLGHHTVATEAQEHTLQRAWRSSNPAALLLVLFCGALITMGRSPNAFALDSDASSQTTTPAAAGNGASDGESTLGEIVVTAQKYQSTVQNTPISISAISGDQLNAAGITDVEELTRNVPGLSMRSAGPGETEYEARGLASNGGASPTVGFYLDEVPLTPPALAQVGKVVIDPNLYDVSRIEVLRGPQGTLYGASSMGGTVRVITNQPQLGIFDGSVQGTLSGTDGGHLNGGGNLMLNLPVGDVFALRFVGSDSYRSGWVDYIALHPFPPDTNTRGNVLAAPVQSVDPDANTEYLDGGRVSALFQPNDSLSVVATAFGQRLLMDGFDQFDNPPGPDYMAHYEAFPLRERLSDQVRIYSLTITDKLGFAEFTSATSYWDRQEGITGDGSESGTLSIDSFPSMSGAVLPGYVYIPYTETDLTRQFSQEIRLASVGSERLHWLVGAFYSDLHSTWIQYSANPAFTALSVPASENPTGIIFESNNPYRIRQYAGFADGSYQFSDNWTFSTGGRWFRYISVQLANEWGEDSASVLPLTTPLRTEAANSGFNPRFNFSYSPNGNLTAYVSASRGFRPGGANTAVPAFCGPSQMSFGPDNAWDYELGEKARLLENHLTVNADVFYIQWNDIQENLLLTCGYEYNSNAGNGRSFGPELEIDARPSSHWTLSASGSYTDARITHPSFALASYLSGTGSCQSVSNCTVPILNVPKDTASVAVIYATSLWQNYQLTARISDSFIGTAVDESFYFGIKLPSYNIADARVSLLRQQWSIDLFLDNFTNSVAWISANNTSFQFNNPGFYRVSTNQPRTVGTQINYHF